MTRCLQPSLRLDMPRGLALALVLPAFAVAAQDDDSLRVLAQVPPGRYYVGQAIELRVGVQAASEKPTVLPPRMEGADVSFIRLDTLQRGTSAIGNRVEERILYVFRYRIVAHRAGSLVIPPVAVRLDDESGRSAPVRVTVRSLPAEGRPASFLGGVGRMEVDANASPTALRVGQTLEYRLRLLGPAARGSTQRPELAFDRLGLGIKIEPLPAEAVADPPSRVWRYRLRPSRPGVAVFPPVPVSYFDPRSGQYLTKTAPGVPIRVIDVPRFDAKTLKYAAGRPLPPVPAATRAWPAARPWLVGLLGCLLAIPLFGVVWWLAAHVLARVRSDPAHYARLSARRLARPFDGAEPLAAEIATRLARYLHLAAGRPEGALTQREATEAIQRLWGDDRLAERVGRLVTQCDVARFSGAPVRPEPLAGEAVALFEELARLDLAPAEAEAETAAPSA